MAIPDPDAEQLAMDAAARNHAKLALQRMTAATRKFCRGKDPNLADPDTLTEMEAFGVRQMTLELELAYHAGIQASRPRRLPDDLPPCGAIVTALRDVTLRAPRGRPAILVPAGTTGTVRYHLPDDLEAIGVAWHTDPCITIEINRAHARESGDRSRPWSGSNGHEFIPRGGK